MKAHPKFGIIGTLAVAIPLALGTLGALATALTLTLGTGQLRAQEPPELGRFNPEQMREQIMERLRELFEVKGDVEWKLIAARLQKVMEASRALGRPEAGPAFGAGRPGGFGAGQGGVFPPMGRAPAGFGMRPDPEAEALQKALEAKASTEDIKRKLAALRDARLAKEAELAKAQEAFREVLSVRQEAIAVSAGLLK